MALGCLLASGPGRATQAPDPATIVPRGYVTDVAGVLDPASRDAIERYLTEVERSLGCQFAVVLLPSLGGTPIEEFAVRLFERWGVGDRALDQGLLLCVATAERQVRFETGYGLEGALPDGKLGGIIRGTIVPRFREGDYAGGIQAAFVEAAAAVAESQGKPAPVPGEGGPAREVRRERPPRMLVLVILLVVIAIAVASAGSGGAPPGGLRGRRRRGGWGAGGGPWYGGGFGGGFGGFGGFGGGGSGGGFGGFGGGLSGGGGASGSW